MDSLQTGPAAFLPVAGFAVLLFLGSTSSAQDRAVAAGPPIGPTITTVAGNGAPSFTGDGGLARRAGLNGPLGVAVDAWGNLWIADSRNHRVRRVDGRTGVITTAAGNGVAGFSSDGVPATEASLWSPSAVAADGQGNLFVADRNNHRIRRVDAESGLISTVAGTGTAEFRGDGRLAHEANLFAPRDLAFDDWGDLYIADRGNHRIRRIAKETGIISTVAGNGSQGFSGDGGLAVDAALSFPSGVAVDSLGNVFIADRENHRVRRVDGKSGLIETFAGTGLEGYAGDGGAARRAELSEPTSLAVGPRRRLFIAELTNHRVRSVDLETGKISTFAGARSFGFGGDSGEANRARLLFPSGIYVDRFGKVYIADTSNQRIRMARSAAKEASNTAD